MGGSDVPLCSWCRCLYCTISQKITYAVLTRDTLKTCSLRLTSKRYVWSTAWAKKTVFRGLCFTPKLPPNPFLTKQNVLNSQQPRWQRRQGLSNIHHSTLALKAVDVESSELICSKSACLQTEPVKHVLQKLISYFDRTFKYLFSILAVYRRNQL